jgi:hypothetical protein
LGNAGLNNESTNENYGQFIVLIISTLPDSTTFGRLFSANSFWFWSSVHCLTYVLPMAFITTFSFAKENHANKTGFPERMVKALWLA